MYCLPGEPVYRFLLGRFLEPPRVVFENFTYNKRRSPLIRFTDRVRPEVETYSPYIDNMIARVQRFRDAESRQNKKD
jgi:hypothetical protein